MDKSKLQLQTKGEALVLIDWANIRNQQKKLGWEIDLEKLYQWLISHKGIEKIQFFYGHRNTEKSKKFLKVVGAMKYEVITKRVKYLKQKIESSNFKNNLEFLKKEIKDINHILKTLEESTDQIDYAEELHYQGFFKNSDKVNSIYEEINTPVTVPKCDFDVEITTEIMKHFEGYQTIILFSGDGDFAYPIQECLNHWKKVCVVSHRDFVGREIWEFKKQNPKKYPAIINLENLDFLKKFPASRS